MRQPPPLFPHPGSVAHVVRHVPAPLLWDVPIVEAFARDAPFALRCSRPGQPVLLYEQDPTTCAIWDFLIHAKPSEIRALPVEHFLRGGRAHDLEPGSLPVGAWHFLARRTADMHDLRRLMSDHDFRKSPHAHWNAVVRDAIARRVRSLRSWAVFDAPPEAAPDIRAAWFLAPPWGAPPERLEALAAWALSRRGHTTALGAPDPWGGLPFRSYGERYPSADCPAKRRDLRTFERLA